MRSTLLEVRGTGNVASNKRQTPIATKNRSLSVAHQSKWWYFFMLSASVDALAGLDKRRTRIAPDQRSKSTPDICHPTLFGQDGSPLRRVRLPEDYLDRARPADLTSPAPLLA